MEKFFNIKCRYSGLKPGCAIIVATVRALKKHGGGPENPSDDIYKKEDLELLSQGVCNLQAHVKNACKFGVKVVVAVNKFKYDTPAEIQLVIGAAMAAGAFRAVKAEHWEHGGAGAAELAQCVVDACEEAKPEDFNFLYELNLPIKTKIKKIVTDIYGGASVTYSDLAEKQIEEYTSSGFDKLPICMAKTQYSLSADMKLMGAPTGFNINVRSDTSRSLTPMHS